MKKKRSRSSKIPSKLNLQLQMSTHRQRLFELMATAEMYKSKRNLDKARESYDELISLSKEMLQLALLHNKHHPSPVEIFPIVNSLVNAMLMQADIIQSVGVLEQAEQMRTEALEFSREHLSASASADAERARATALIGQGRFNEALVGLSACRDLFQSEGNTPQLARTTIDIADMLQWLGDYKRALSEIEHAAAIIEPLLKGRKPTQQDFGESLLKAASEIMAGKGNGRQAQDIAALYRMSVEIDYFQGLINKYLGKYEIADALLRKVLREYQKVGQGADIAVEYQLASILVGKGNYEEALEYTKHLEKYFENGGFLRQKMAGLLKIQAEALLKLNRLEEANRRLERGIGDLSRYYDPDLLWKLQWLRGRTLETMDRRVEALGAYIEAASTVNDLRKAPLGYRLDSTYLSDKVELFRNAIDLACRTNSAEMCCSLMEMIKSRILTATLSVPQVSEPPRRKRLEDQVDELSRQLDAIEYKGFKKKKLTDAERQNQSSLLAKRQSLLERIRFSDPRWRNMTEPVGFDFQRVAKIIADKGQAAISLFYQEEHTTAVMLKDNICTVGYVKLSKDIRSKLELYQSNLQTSKSDRNMYDMSGQSGIAAGHLLPPDMLEQALQAEAVMIIPHGPMHLVPWAGMVFNGKRLFEYCPVGVLPNLSCIPSLSVRFSAKPKIALFGAPDYGELIGLEELPGAEQEIADVKGMYTDQRGSRLICDIMVGKNATEEKFRNLLARPETKGGILHIVCHATFDLSDPMNSGLLLTNSKMDASEIARSVIRFDEVVLSGCHTGWRPTKVRDIKLAGDDVLGLPGAFMEAGARSVLVSIPPVPDLAALTFMGIYHEYRVKGEPPLMALQQTQITMLENGRYPPEQWVGFTVYGCH